MHSLMEYALERMRKEPATERERYEREVRAIQEQMNAQMPAQMQMSQPQNQYIYTSPLPGSYSFGVDGGLMQSVTVTSPGTWWWDQYGVPMPVGGSAANYESGAAAHTPVRQALVEAPSRSMLKRVPAEVQNLDLNDPRQKLAAEAEDLLGYTPLRKELRTPGTLRRVLAKLEIAVLEQESVDAYKAQMAEHYRTANKMADPTWRLTPLKQYAQPVPEFVLHKAVQIKRELPEAEFYVDQLAVDPFLIVSLGRIGDTIVNCERKLDPEKAAYVEVWSEPKFEASL